MAVVPCRECGRKVSTEAPACPHCGAAKPARRGDPCRECGTGLLEATEVCPHCGAPNPLPVKASPQMQGTRIARTSIYGHLSRGAPIEKVFNQLIEEGWDEQRAEKLVNEVAAEVTQKYGKGVSRVRAFAPGVTVLGNNSGEGRGTVVPREVRGWNWGAFFLGWIWGLGNSTYIALLELIPVVGLVMMFVLGARGSEWAWQNRRWQSVEHFKKVQHDWAIWGVSLFVIGILFLILFS